MSKAVQTQISAVTVYTDQALVTRRGFVQLDSEQELVITGLPVTLQTESVRAGGAGTGAVRLLGVRVERNYATEPVVERVAQLSQEITQHERQKRSIQDTLAALELQRHFVQELSEKSVERFALAIARQQQSLEETRALVSFLGQQYSDLSSAIAQREIERQEIDKQLNVLRQQLQQVQTPQPQESFSIIVTIESQAAGNFELEVSYVVTQASWTPLYDLRVNSSSKQIHLSYLAEVQQTTGEDWLDVALTLSTAKPGLGMLPPKLPPWYIDVARLPLPAAPMMRRRRGMDEEELEYLAGAAGTADDEAVSRKMLSQAMAGAAPAPIEATTVAARVSREGRVVTFRLDRGGNIPSDGTPHNVTIVNDDYPCRFDYIVMPQLVSFAYLEAAVKNPPTGATLLPGKANVFRDDTFVGTTQLENIAPGQEFKINLGIDESLAIERDLVERQVDKKLIGGQRRMTYAYRLSLASLTEQPTNLKLIERLPVSRNEQVKVRLIRTNPQIQLGEMGILEWLLSLPPQSKQELYYQFAVEHPSELTVLGLDI